MEIRKDRLRQVVEAVKNTDDANWDMGQWMQFEDGCGTVGCGTVGCAIGNYCIQNPGCGLSLKIRNNGSSVPIADDRHNFDAVADHFGIGLDDAMELFELGGYMDEDSDEDSDEYFRVARETVIHRIEQFINDNANPIGK